MKSVGEEMEKKEKKLQINGKESEKKEKLGLKNERRK